MLSNVIISTEQTINARGYKPQSYFTPTEFMVLKSEDRWLMVCVIVIKYNEIYLFENFQVVLQDFLVVANGFFLMKQSSTLGRGLDSGQRALHLIKDNLKLAYYNLLLFLPSFRCDCNTALKPFFVSFFLSSTNHSYQSFREGGKKQKMYIYNVRAFFTL